MNSRQQLPARLYRPAWRRRWDQRHAWQTRGAGRHLYGRRRGLRRFAGVGLAFAVALCALAVFA